MEKQENIDDDLIGMFDEFSTTTDRIKFIFSPTTSPEYLKSILTDVNRFFKNTHKISMGKDFILGEGNYYNLVFIVSDKIEPIPQVKPDENLDKWAANLANLIIKEAQNHEQGKRIKSFEPYYPDPDGFHSSCLQIQPNERSSGLSYILSAFFRRHTSVKNPRLITKTANDGSQQYFLKMDVSCKKNSGYDSSLLSGQNQAIIQMIIKNICKNIQPDKKQQKSKGKSKHL